MKILKFATLTVMMLALSTFGFSKAAKPENLVRGIVGPVTSNVSWSGYSTFALIPGAGLIPVTSSTTVFYLGFTAGTQVDINNMVLYTTPRGSLTISAVTPIKLGGVSNPSIDLANPTVCPVVEISAFNPCIVRLDPTTITLSALSDYYLVVYFTASDGNDQSVGLTTPSFSQSSLRGSYQSGDDSRLSVGGTIPTNLGFSAQPYMLMYVMTD
jgi:hypothetical protein